MSISPSIQGVLGFFITTSLCIGGNLGFNEECKVRMEEYLAKRYSDECTNLFRNIFGEPLKKERVQDYFKTFSEKLNIKITPKTMRHTFAAHLAMRGMPLAYIQDLLGHEDINTTLTYARLYDHVRKDKYDKHI